jgi:hypothetical protein
MNRGVEYAAMRAPVMLSDCTGSNRLRCCRSGSNSSRLSVFRRGGGLQKVRRVQKLQNHSLCQARGLQVTRGWSTMMARCNPPGLTRKRWWR